MIFTIILFLSALFISGIAGWFSIAGLMAIFPGAKISVAIMGISLELGKLVSASWLYRFWDKSNKLMKAYFICAVIVLSFITSVGIFGYLSRSHIEGTEGINQNSEQITLLDNQINIEKQSIESQKKALTQLDASIDNLVQKEPERAVIIRNRQKNERNLITNQINKSNEKIIDLERQKAVLNIGQRKLETEVGPIKYFAQMIYNSNDTTTIEKAVRLLILVLIFVFDPLAILLVVAANMQVQNNQTHIIAPQVKQEKKSVKENITSMNTDWNPGSWFKVVKDPT